MCAVWSIRGAGRRAEPLTGAGRWLYLSATVLAWVLVAAPWAPATAQAPGATPVSVEGLVARAVADNPELRAARAEIEAAVGRLHQAALRPNPMLDLGGQRALGPDNNLMIGLTVPLDLNGRRDGRVGVAQRELEMKHALVAERERRLRAELRLKAGEHLAARRNLAVTDTLLQANREALELIRARVAQGATPPLEENLMLVEVNRLEAPRQVLASRAEVAAMQLKTLAGMPVEWPLTLAGDLRLEEGRAWAREDAVRSALAGRPDLDAARADVAMAGARIRKEEAEGRWDASINVGYQRQNFGYDLRGLTAGGGTRPIQDVFHYFGGGVTVTLPVRNRNEGNVAAAGAERTAAERRLDAATLAIRQEVEAAITQHDAARRALDIYERGVREVAQRNLDVVRQTHSLGRGTLLDVIAEQRRYIDVEHGYTEALRQVYDAAVEIRRVLGQ